MGVRTCVELGLVERWHDPVQLMLQRAPWHLSVQPVRVLVGSARPESMGWA